MSTFRPGLIESLIAKIRVSSPIIEVRVTAGDIKQAQLTQGILWEDSLFSKRAVNAVNDLYIISATMHESQPHQKI